MGGGEFEDGGRCTQENLKYEIKKGDHGMWIPDLEVIEVASQRDVMRVVEEGLFYRAVRSRLSRGSAVHRVPLA